MTYEEFVMSKVRRLGDAGFDAGELPSFLFDFQRHIVTKALKRGRYAIFAECGLGKTPMQLVWADAVMRHTGKPVLILTPLAVAAQTKREGDKFGIPVHFSRDGEIRGITVTNYEHIHKFHAGGLGGIVLDESSILKNFNGKMRKDLSAFASLVQYRLSATATPAPNDFVEFGTQAEFLGVGTHTEMLSTYFVHDGGDTSKWRLKRHAIKDFKRWMGEWSITLDHPKDIGYDVEGFTLPELVETEIHASSSAESGFLFEQVAISLNDQRQQKKRHIEGIAEAVCDIALSNREQYIVWVDNNYEADAIKSLIPDAVEIRGSDDADLKARRMIEFSDGLIRVLVTKPSIAGFGMNWQQCHNMIFSSVGHSYEQRYQAVRRCYRFGQKKPVNVYTIRYAGDDAISVNYKRKDTNAKSIKQTEVTQ